MAKYRGPVCRLCRREGGKLFLKGARCMTEKCAVERRAYPPGQHGQGRPRVSEYSAQLREKQKLKRIYGVLERQFRGTFAKAERQRGITGENLLRMLERRLDNVVYRLGFAASRKEARQLVNHGHFRVNGRKVNQPAFLVREGEVIEVKERSRQILPIKAALEMVDARGVPAWLDLDRENMKATVRGLPAREEIAMPVNEQLVVDLYSR
ncbi:MAG TPA: 30S ribosomal protein S4 [Nitrospirales bacterium]|nr:30S ribosomal protein S4 [Nitrospirales bacterium]